MTAVDQHVAVGEADDRADGYRPSRTLRVGVEARRQLTRRRTQLALGFLVLLPVILAVAFKVGGTPSGRDRNGPDAFRSLANLATGGAINFTLFTLLVSSTFLLVVVVALFCGDTVASEASWGSLRYLLAVPVPRARLLGVKLVVALAYATVALLLLAGSALLVGYLSFGWHDLGTPLGGQVGAGSGLVRLLGVLAYLAVTLLPVAGLAFLLSVSTDAPLGAVGGAVLLMIVANILDAVTALGSLRDGLPGHYATAWLGLLSSPVQTDDMARGAIVGLAYGATFAALAWWRFLRKDIVS